MPSFSIEQVLACKSLPTLPTVAVEVLELTRDPHVAMDRISRSVQNDAALTAKVLRTVNSSYYGLSKKCSTLGRALGYLGLNTVKSVVLGFCLVDCTKAAEGGGFDLVDYWRRGLTSAPAARLFASHLSPGVDPDEAFTACLFQDIGMLACFAALGGDYARLLLKAPADHGLMLGYEEDTLGFTHPEVGARLAEKWGLPGQLVACIRFHHGAQQAPEEYRPLLRTVSLAGAAACAMTPGAAPSAMASLLETAAGWYGADAETMRGLLERIADDARRLAHEFDRDLGERPDVASLMSDANDRLLDLRLQSEQEAESLRKTTSELEKQNITDALTGAFNRRHFDEKAAEQFQNARRDGRPLGVLFCDADRFKSINDTHGHACGDVVLKAISQRLAAAVGASGMVHRHGGEEFAVLLPGQDEEGAAALAEKARASIAAGPIDIAAAKPGAAPLTVTISIGAAAFDPARSAFESASALVHAADQAAYAAKRNGRNRVERAGAQAPALDPAPAPARTTDVASSPAAAAPSPAQAVRPRCKPSGGTIDVLLVENDPLASRLIVTLLGKRPDLRLTAVAGGAEALGCIARGPRPSIILTDLQLQGMSGLQLLGALRADASTRAIPVVVLSSSSDPQDERSCRSAGAAAFINKQVICTDLAGALAAIYAAAGATAAVAA